MAGIAVEWLGCLFYAPLALAATKGGLNWLRRRMARGVLKARSLVVDSLSDLVIVLDAEDRVIDLNQAARISLGLEDFEGEISLDRLSAAWAAVLRRCLAFEACREEVQIEGKVYDLNLMPLRTPQGGLDGRVCLLREITAEKKSQEMLLQLSRAVEQSPATIVITDTRGAIEYVNPKFTELTGYTFEEAIGANPRMQKSNLNPPEIYRDLWDTLLAGREWRGEFINRKKNGDLYYELAVISPILDGKGRATHFVAVKEDITERKKAEEQMQYLNEALQLKLREVQALQAILQEQAIRDPLTGLYNRRYLDETLEREFLLAEREGYPVGVAMIDVDKFKEINDRYGHAAGDRILCTLAEEMKKNTRASDIVCRYGGDEFVVVMFNTNVKGLDEYARRLCAAFRALKFDFEAQTIQSRLSIGVATFPKNGDTSQQVLAAADAAMYLAKQEGRNRVVVAGETERPD